MFQTRSIRVVRLENGIVELVFDRQSEYVNKLDSQTVADLSEAAALIDADSDVTGVLITSTKDSFIVGADITEFGRWFQMPEADVAKLVASLQRSFEALSQLKVPTVAAINGVALGGGLETTLAADLRIMSSHAQIGLPEVKLGLIPGFGGTVRLPRMVGMAAALDMITTGIPLGAVAARKAGVVDEVAEPAAVRAAALTLLQLAIDGAIDWRGRREVKAMPVHIADATVFSSIRSAITQRTSKHQPAALTAVELIERACGLHGAEALALEAQAFAALCKTQAAASLVQIFLNEQVLKKKYKQHANIARPLKQAAVLGAGIMGGGISYTSALSGIPVRMKDIRQQQLDIGMSEAHRLLEKQIRSGRMTKEKADAVLTSIQPQLDYACFNKVDAVVEAVVENIKVKHAVLTEVESAASPDTVIASNTSSLLIDDLAVPLKRPENFVGMHFFNPVPLMPLVEIIKGTKTSDIAVSTMVGYAVAMKKTPVVVKDRPGFLVNRVLTPYMLAASRLIADGADFMVIDKVMEKFGWPMGPSYLNDVIGMDTGKHVFETVSSAFSERMQVTWNDSVSLMTSQHRLGRKTGLGFYKYEADSTGGLIKSVAPDSPALLATLQPNGLRSFSEKEIIERMMLPMIIEAAYALEEGVAASAAEVDMALLLGLGFPQYLGGPLKYADWLGMDRVVTLCQSYTALGPLYQPSRAMLRMATDAKRYY